MKQRKAKIHTFPYLSGLETLAGIGLELDGLKLQRRKVSAMTVRLFGGQSRWPGDQQHPLVTLFKQHTKSPLRISLPIKNKKYKKHTHTQRSAHCLLEYLGIILSTHNIP